MHNLASFGEWLHQSENVAKADEPPRLEAARPAQWPVTGLPSTVPWGKRFIPVVPSGGYVSQVMRHSIARAGVPDGHAGIRCNCSAKQKLLYLPRLLEGG